MHDDFESPVWAEHHAKLSAAINRAIDKLLYAFEWLTAQQFDSPWDKCRG